LLTEATILRVQRDEARIDRRQENRSRHAAGTSEISAQYETPREASSDRRGRLSTSE
jgi:hypothetical protein